MPELDTGTSEHLGRLPIHAVALAVDNFADTDLDDLDGAGEAGTGIAIENTAVADALATRLKQRVLLGVQAEAGGEGGARTHARIAAGAAALAAVADAARGPVVAGADDAALAADEHAADGPLHAVGALRRQRGQRHEVVVPRGPQPLRVRQVQLAQRRVQVRQRARRIEQPHRRPRDEGEHPRGPGVEVVVRLGDELLERRRRGRCGGGGAAVIVVTVAAGLVPAPSYHYWRVDADQDEEGTAGEDVQNGFIVDVRCYPARSPALGYEVQEISR